MEPDQRLAQEIIARYPFAAPVRCELRSSGLNDLYEVTADDATYFLKIYRAGWRTAADVEQEIAVLHHLERKSVPVALPVACRDGSFVWTRAEPGRERAVALFESAPGTVVFPPDVPACRLMGETLAAIHNATSDFGQAPVRYDLENLLFAPWRVVEPFLADRPDDQAYLRRLAGRLREKIERLPASELDYGYCHGDFRSANVHLDPETGVATTFDFELGGLGFRAYDLAYTLTSLDRMALETLWGAPPMENGKELAGTFLNDYYTHRHHTRVEIEAVSLMVPLRAIRMMGDIVEGARANAAGNAWPPVAENGLPGGDLFYRAIRFLRAWDAVYL